MCLYKALDFAEASAEKYEELTNDPQLKVITEKLTVAEEQEGPLDKELFDEEEKKVFDETMEAYREYLNFGRGYTKQF